jgi:hypothetical protein
MQKAGLLILIACLFAVSLAKSKPDRYGKTSRNHT